jgi:rhamnosyltransferase
VVVAFHPDSCLPARLEAVAGQVRKVLVIDNTPSPAWTVKSACGHIANLEWQAMQANVGVASALNIGIAAARSGGFTHLLALDQDSLLPEGAVQQLLATLLSQREIAVVGPIYHGSTGHRSWIPWRRGIFLIPYSPPPATGLYDSFFAITSGSMLDVRAAERIGPFDDGLFIDSVDQEFCLRAWRSGYRVVINSAVDMVHELGARSEGGILGLRTVAPNHSALRRYYIARNRVLLYKRHGLTFPQYVLYDLMAAILEIALVILVERDRGAKIRMMWTGFRDGFRGITGPFNERKS